VPQHTQLWNIGAQSTQPFQSSVRAAVVHEQDFELAPGESDNYFARQ
jgi:hypothetical protein